MLMVYQILVTIVRGDAIGNYTCAIDKIIRDLGYETQIYAENCGQGFPDGYVLPIDKMPKPEVNDIIIYQMCEASRINAMLKKWDCRKIAIFHNITPAEFFHGFSPEQERSQRASNQWDILRT